MIRASSRAIWNEGDKIVSRLDPRQATLGVLKVGTMPPCRAHCLALTAMWQAMEFGSMNDKTAPVTKEAWIDPEIRTLDVSETNGLKRAGHDGGNYADSLRS